MKLYTALLFICICLSTLSSIGQTHLEPPDGEEGVPGSVKGSFIIKWASEPGAVNYEYVMSDNPLCFSGCSGDTRQHKTGGDTNAVEYNIIEDKWYYWITRIYYDNGDTSGWSHISSFLAKTPELTADDPFISITPNPVNTDLTLTIDWAIRPDERIIRMTVYSIKGELVKPLSPLKKKVSHDFRNIF